MKKDEEEKVVLMKKTFASNLKRNLDKTGSNQTIMARDLGIPETTVSNWMKASTYPRPDKIQMMADYFHIMRSDLTEERSNDHEYSKVTTLSIIRTICYDNGVLVYDDIEGYEEVPSSWVKGAKHLLLRAKGDNMIKARIEDGDLLLIREQETFENGEIMAVMIDGDVVLKRMYLVEGSIMLQSENAKYPPKFISGQSEIKIIGKLIMNLIHY